MANTREAPALAIVGFAFEFPQDATSSNGFWDMIVNARSATTEFPSDRVNIDAFYHPSQERPSTIPVRGGNFLREDIRAFDAPFFSITPGEAACMDPQHRRMLETSYHALENAGIPIDKCFGTDTSVYTGCFTNDYINLLQQDFELEQKHAAMGIAPSMLANRVSWFFNFKGTSMNIDSACSSGLLALHLAAQDLHAGNCSMALVGGANLVYHPNFMKIMSAFQFLSPDSQSWSFDARCNGYARGEGLVMLVLKRVEDALRDSDCIRAIIRSTGSNQDGRTPGITQPSLQSQVQLIKRTYRKANLDMTPTRYFEAHGPGTPVGDPIEASAIGEAFKQYRTSRDPLYVGSVKANIGHLEGASGLAGLIKTLLVLERGVIPPIAGFESLNPRIDDTALCLKFPKEAMPWPSTGLRRACLNSFGFGGTNATVILDDVYHYLESRGLEGYHQTSRFPATTHQNGYAVDEEFPDLQRPKLIVWSAADKYAVEELGDAYHKYICQSPTSSEIADAAYSVATRRSHLNWRGFAIAGLDKQASADSCSTSPVRSRDVVKVAFVFTGQGAQYPGMGRELLSQPVFGNTIRLIDGDLKSLGCTWTLQWLLRAIGGNTPMDRAEYSQVATTCVQIALVDLLESLGIMPSVVLGHSSGEIAAAYASGALSRAAAVKVAYYRGLLSSRLANRNTDTGMMAVGMSRDRISDYLARVHEDYGLSEVEVGCVNSPNSITLTGRVKQLKIIQELLESDAVFTRLLRVPLAYHSSSMQAIAEDYLRSVGELSSGPQSRYIPMVSSVAEDIVTRNVLQSAEYWVRNLTSTVKFEGALSRLLHFGNRRSRRQLGRDQPVDLTVTHFLEIGPHQSLQGPISETVQASNAPVRPEYISFLRRGRDAYVSLLCTAGRLFCAGYPIDLLSVNGLEDTPRPAPPNLPVYPFNHQHLYWKEGRISKNFRFPELPRHDLLGTRNLDWNPQIAQWRNIIRLNEVPWLRDHTIEGQIVFPGTAMVVMAVEALRQLPWASLNCTTIELEDVRFLHAARFAKGTEEVETQLTLTTELGTQSPETPWSHFMLFVMENGSYIECCRGLIRGSIASRHQDQLLPFSSGTPFRTWVTEIMDACPHQKDVYVSSTRSTVSYGPCFQSLRQTRLGPGGRAFSAVSLGTWKAKVGDGPSSPYSIHPCTMDGLAQLVVPALAYEHRNLPTMVPVRASRIWIDVSEPSLWSHGEILAAAQCSARGHRGARANIVGAAKDLTELLLYIEDLETTFISDTLDAEAQEAPRNLCTSLAWKPDIDMLTHEQLLREVCRGRPSEPTDALQRHESRQLAILHILDKVTLFFQKHSDITVLPHLQRYVKWMKLQSQRFHGKVTLDHTSYERHISEAEASGFEGAFFMTVGRNLTAILSGETDPLDILFRNGLADSYYEQTLASSHHAYPITRLIELCCFKNPSLRILEVGAGTGGQTLPILQTLCSDGVHKCAQYDYTDISPAFFPKARDELFQNYQDIMRFRTFDVSRDPAAQSFKPNSYDIVVASHVLHAVDRLDDALKNIKEALKPGGRLILVETTDIDTLQLPFVFGLLKGWWSPLDNDPQGRAEYSPCLTLSEWEGRLKKSGFSGIDMGIPGQEHPQCRYSSIIVSTALSGLDAVPEVHEEDLLLIRNPDQAYQCEVAASIDDVQRALIKTLAESAQLKIGPSTIIVVLLEVEETFLCDISATNYALLQTIMTRARNTLWITRPRKCGQPVPQHSLVEGFGRTLASEDSARKFMTLALDGHESLEEATDLILCLLEKIATEPVDSLETTFSVSAGIPMIPRVSQNQKMNSIIYQYTHPWKQEEWHLGSLHPEHKATLRVSSSCRLEYKEDRQSLLPVLEEDEVIIEVRAFGLTLRDYLNTVGQLDEDDDLGTQCAGIIQQAGAQTYFQPGDRVCAIGTAVAGTTVRTRCNAVVAIPSQLSFAQAAALSTPLWLASYTLNHVARLEPGATVLIHNACSSSIGQMATWLAVQRGARVFVTVNNETQRNFVRTTFGLKNTAVLSLDDEPLTIKMQRITDRGIDIIVRLSTAADGSEDLSRCLAPCGHIVDITWGQPIPSQRTGGMPLLNTTQSLVDAVGILRLKPYTAGTVFQQAMKEYLNGESQPLLPIHTYAAGSEQEALQRYADTDMIGESVIQFDGSSSITVNCFARPRYFFREDVSYMIAGGLGGLGRSIARWMASRGARHMILLSRSGPQSPAAQALVEELNDMGVQVATPRANVGNLLQLEQTLVDLSTTMPPVRGCIQATVALRDNLYEKMSYEDWLISTDSKVTGSWNLHKALPHDLDFFIFLSSLNGIFGSRAQANYAAGNTFKDALAHHRLAQNQKAVSIDLGLMVAEGVVAESEFLLSAMRRIGHLMEIAQDELLALLDYYCDPTLPLLSRTEAQVIVGIELPSDVVAKGIDLHHSIRRPLFRHLFQMGAQKTAAPDGSTAEQGEAVSLARPAELKKSSSAFEATELIIEWVTAKVAHVLGMSAADIEPSKPVHTYGIDSLVAVDLKNWFDREIGASITVFDLMGNTPLRRLSEMAAEASRYRV